MREFDNSTELIDSRDIIAKINDLEGEIEEMVDENDPKDCLAENMAELKILKALVKECQGYGNWQYGAALINDDYFIEYAQQLAEDCCEMSDADKWPYTCISWERAAEELQQDYMSVDYDGATYWMRA